MVFGKFIFVGGTIMLAGLQTILEKQVVLSTINADDSIIQPIQG